MPSLQIQFQNSSATTDKLKLSAEEEKKQIHLGDLCTLVLQSWLPKVPNIQG